MVEHQVTLETSTMDISEKRTDDVYTILIRGLKAGYTDTELDRLTDEELTEAAKRHDPGRGERAFSEALARLLRDRGWQHVIGR